MKKLIDFDAEFNEKISSWAEKLLDQGKKAEEIEAMIPEKYQEWSKSAASYFEELSPDELTEMLGAYLDEEINVPDVLAEKIEDTPECEQEIYRMFGEERSEDDKILLMTILANMNSLIAVKDYIRICARNEQGPLTDAAIDALKYCGPAVSDELLALCEEESDPYVLENFLYILVYTEPRVDGLADKLIALLKQTDHKAIVAGLMSFYGDSSCLPALKDAENAEGISYIDYVEICDAIEALGGETTREREFDGDDYYELVQNGGLSE